MKMQLRLQSFIFIFFPLFFVKTPVLSAQRYRGFYYICFKISMIRFSASML